MRLDASTAALTIFTYKKGLLSRVAHDLAIDVTAFALDLEADAGGVRVELSADPTSLRVAHAMRGGVPARGLLSAGDRRSIERAIVEEVLESALHRDIRFAALATADGAGWRIGGLLSLHGSERRLETRARRDGADWVAEVALDQRDFGIRPYSAMLGALRIEPEVRVQVRVPDVRL